MSLITRKIASDSVDCYRSHNALDVSDFYHERINHSAVFANGKNHINGIENFWNQAKRVLRKYNGIPKNHFRYSSRNASSDSTTEQQLKLLKEWTEI